MVPNIRGLPERLILHIPSLDAEHQALARVLDRIAQVAGLLDPDGEYPQGNESPKLADCLGREPQTICDDEVCEAVLNLLEELEQLTAAHFTSEESLMASAGYPELGTHRSEHMLLMAELADFIREIRDDRKCLQQSHLAALQGWFYGHIALADKAFETFFHAHQEASMTD